MIRVAAALALALLWSPPAGAQDTQEADEGRIRDIVASQRDAWNRGNAGEYANRFQSHGSFTVLAGTTFDTRIAFQEWVTQAFATTFKGSVLAQTIRSVLFVQPDVAIVNMETAITGHASLRSGVSDSSGGALRTAMLQVFVRKGGYWRVAALHDVDVKTR
jgi:uncharacterized protein (TIGR02246 family)